MKDIEGTDVVRNRFSYTGNSLYKIAWKKKKDSMKDSVKDKLEEVDTRIKYI